MATATWYAGGAGALMAGSAHSATAQQLIQLWPPAYVSRHPATSLAQAVETAWSVEPVCATTPISMKDPTVSTTRPSVQDSEASSATTAALASWVSVRVLWAGRAAPVSVPRAPRPAWTARARSAAGEVNVSAAAVSVQTQVSR